MWGISTRQGPHQEAQNSTSTNLLLARTSASRTDSPPSVFASKSRIPAPTAKRFLSSDRFASAVSVVASRSTSPRDLPVSSRRVRARLPGSTGHQARPIQWSGDAPSGSGCVVAVCARPSCSMLIIRLNTAEYRSLRVLRSASVSPSTAGMSALYSAWAST